AHLVLLRALVVAYSRLLPLVAATPTASTLAVLLPRRLAAWQHAWERHESPADLRTLHRCLAALYLQAGPHALAGLAAAEDPEDPELAKALEILASLGYGKFEALDPVEVRGGLRPCALSGWRAE